MLEQDLAAQLRQYLTLLRRPITLTASLGTDDGSRRMRELLTEIAGMSDRITLWLDGTATHRPSFTLTRQDGEQHLTFAAIPLGHEFTSLVLALLWTGGHPPKVEPGTIEKIRALPGTYDFKVYMSLSCHNCPDVVQALTLMAVYNPKVRVTVIDGGLFQKEVDELQIMAVPTLYLDGKMIANGRMGVDEIIGLIDRNAGVRDAEKLSAKAPYDVLIVGGGPAGSAAAIYAARKGLRTGIVAERFGGQVLDTLAIENFISVKETDGPKLAAGLEQHVKEYNVDIMNLQRAEALTQGEDGFSEVRLASGAVLKAKSVIISTGARWRNMNVPGEQEYKARGVAYCPHCDGPLFKGKRVAVIGGGNSGVEAAIDLAGIVAHVTLIEFDTFLRADAVLQKKLYSLPNVRVILHALTSEVTGDGEKVNGLVYKDRTSNEMHKIELEGIFVQIGLLPNTDWLKGTINLSPRGEIEVDPRGQTSLPGVFAAGDCTTVPYKQIIIAMGEGAKASLGAFDHLIRTSAPA